jgi:poly(A) polymerase
MNIELATEAVRTLQKAGHVAYFAGGCVRDQLLGRPAKDFDVATSATPDEVQHLFPRTTGLEGKCFGVIRVLLGENLTLEVATFRQDLEYEDGRRPSGVRFVTAEEDAQRRDFTVNGLFFDPIQNRLIDYVGGQADLQKQILRAIGQPAARFQEDKLRLLRAIRFATNLEFTMEPATWEAIRELAPAVQQIAIERVRDELDKIWTGPFPARGLDLLDQSGLLSHLLPEITAMHGVEQPPQFHPEGDVFKHTRLMLSHLSHAPLELALAVLFHDVGKPRTQITDATGRIRFNEHETVGARMTEAIMLRFKYSNNMIEAVRQCVAFHMQFKDAPKMKLSTLKRMLARETFPTEMELHRIDCLGSHRDVTIYEFLKNKQAELGVAEIKPPRLVTGQDVMALGVVEGPRIGQLLELIREAQLEGQIRTREEALARLRELV